MVIPSSRELPDGTSQPRSSYTGGERDRHVPEREEVLAVAQQRQGLVAEGRHRREASTEPGREEDAPLVAEEPALERERHHEPDDEAADDVHGERAGGEQMAV